MISATAPGKIILFGEHAVVYGRPALAIPVLQVGVTVLIETDLSNTTHPGDPIPSGESWLDRVTIDAPEIGRKGSLASYHPRQRPDPIATLIQNICNVLSVPHPPAMHIRIQSSIPVASGLGSGAAVSVALIRALAGSLGKTLPPEQVSGLAFEIEKLYHGTPSGIDNTVITYAQPVYFIKDRPIETFTVGKPFTLVIADSGKSASTRASVGDVRRQWQAEPERMEKIFSSIAEIVQQARQAIQAGDIDTLGALMNQNQALLQELTVSSPGLDRLTTASLAAGALGAKLSGGGRGGNMIALVQPAAAPGIAAALCSAGARSTIITHVA
jgi:mevalonate kinase